MQANDQRLVRFLQDIGLASVAGGELSVTEAFGCRILGGT